jgi:hypothetical protein
MNHGQPSNEATPCVIKLNAHDFDLLSFQRMHWATKGWNTGDDAVRFESLLNDPNQIGYHWEYAHWVGDDWTRVILARSFLDSINHAYEIVLDTTLERRLSGSYVILTHYAGRRRTPSEPMDPKVKNMLPEEGIWSSRRDF